MVPPKEFDMTANIFPIGGVNMNNLKKSIMKQSGQLNPQPLPNTAWKPGRRVPPLTSSVVGGVSFAGDLNMDYNNGNFIGYMEP